MLELVKRLVIEEEGADATEYALLAALIAIAIIGGATLLGTNIGSMFTAIGGLIGTKSATV
ncbi:MAG: Flp family type IVb pilin [Chloroflexi bacterium]|nr:Flp family type IVb pilin [Chloroflexota bacterium]